MAAANTKMSRVGMGNEQWYGLSVARGGGLVVPKVLFHFEVFERVAAFGDVGLDVPRVRPGIELNIGATEEGLNIDFGGKGEAVAAEAHLFAVDRIPDVEVNADVHRCLSSLPLAFPPPPTPVLVMCCADLLPR